MTGIGCDIERIDRFRKVLNNKEFLSNIFTDEEMQYCYGRKRPELYFARKFASKEAVFKALASLGHSIPLKLIEIISKDKDNMVRIQHKNIKKGYKIFVSISDEKEVVLASSIVQKT